MIERVEDYFHSFHNRQPYEAKDPITSIDSLEVRIIFLFLKSDCYSIASDSLILCDSCLLVFLVCLRERVLVRPQTPQRVSHKTSFQPLKKRFSCDNFRQKALFLWRKKNSSPPFLINFFWLSFASFHRLSSQGTNCTTMSSKASADTNRQIKQMVNFIMQEAHEKVNEVRIKV